MDQAHLIGKTLLAEAGDGIYEAMIEQCMPSLAYTAKEQTMGMSFAKVAAMHIEGLLPYVKYLTEEEAYQTQIESELTYRMIIEQEAMDENYVDEKTGQVVADRNQTAQENNTDQTKEKDDAAAKENGTDTESQTKADEDTRQASVTVKEETAVAASAYPIEKLNDFDYLIQNFYIVDNSTTITGERLNASNLLAKSMKLTTTPEEPQILIYHTHSQERYADSSEDIMTGVVGVGEYLTSILHDQYGLNVLHDMGTYDVQDRDHAYEVAGPAVTQILADHPSIQVVIDLHRDGVDENTRLVTEVNGKQVASVMLFNGLSYVKDKGDIEYLPNPYIEDNLAFSLQMRLAAEERYPKFCRAVYLKGYRYNMHLCPHTLLVEVGAQTNTFEEARAAMVPLAEILNSVINN